MGIGLRRLHSGFSVTCEEYFNPVIATEMGNVCCSKHAPNFCEKLYEVGIRSWVSSKFLSRQDLHWETVC